MPQPAQSYKWKIDLVDCTVAVDLLAKRSLQHVVNRLQQEVFQASEMVRFQWWRAE